MARTEKPIDWNYFELALKAGCSQKKIAGHLQVEPDTLRKRVKEKYDVDYSVLSAEMSQSGEGLLEIAQFQKALNKKAPGDTQMLIWLGKVRLKQKEPGNDSVLSPNDAGLNELIEGIKAQNAVKSEANTELQ